MLLKVLGGLFLSPLRREQENYLSFGRIENMLSLTAVSIIGLNRPSAVPAQSPQSNQNGNTTVTILNNNSNVRRIT
ncbi:MAG TPA: hypothetical protein VKA09_18510 [Nitrososphaeraceae archaeon]|nr:hypothetical protein [Nitrososphaeraceae archaeon]